MRHCTPPVYVSRDGWMRKMCSRPIVVVTPPRRRLGPCKKPPPQLQQQRREVQRRLLIQPANRMIILICTYSVKSRARSRKSRPQKAVDFRAADLPHVISQFSISRWKSASLGAEADLGACAEHNAQWMRTCSAFYIGA